MPGRDPLIGAVLNGAYRLEERLGAGGMGAVYRAVQLNVGREVAIKVLHPEGVLDADMRARLSKRFIREARATSKLSHPHTVRLFDFGETPDGTLFLVLELLRGQDLASLIRREVRLSPARAAHIGVQICKSLNEAHKVGIVHRDLKPENIFVVPYEDDPDFVKVVDFGIARVLVDDLTSTQLTGEGRTLGTPAYMAPEQAMAEAIGPPVDLYALGIILYEMLVGRLPFEAETPMGFALKHISEPPPPLDVPALRGPHLTAWRLLVGALLNKKPEDRPASAADVAERLQAIRGHAASEDVTASVEVNPQALLQALDTHVSRPGMRAARRRRWWPVLAGVGGAVVAATLTIALLGGPGSAPSLDAPLVGPVASSEGTVAVPKPAIVTPPSTPAGRVRVRAPAVAEAPEPSAGPETEAAHLLVASKPSGAEVRRGEELVCSTPCDVRVPPGRGVETVRVTLDGHRPASAEVTLGAGATVARSFVLREAGAAKRSTHPSKRSKSPSQSRGTSNVSSGRDGKGAAKASPRRALPGIDLGRPERTTPTIGVEN